MEGGAPKVTLGGYPVRVVGTKQPCRFLPGVGDVKVNVGVYKGGRDIYTPNLVYTSLKITPAHMQISRSVHKHAVFVLGQEIAHTFTDLDPDSSRRMASWMKESADTSVQEPELVTEPRR